MRYLRKGATVLVGAVLFVFASQAVGQQRPQAFAEPGLYGQDSWVMAEEMRDLHAWLMREKAQRPISGISVPVTRQDLLDIGQEAAGDGALRAEPRRYRVGVTIPVGARVDFAKLSLGAGQSREFAQGVASKRSDGFSWTTVVRSPNATALRVRFDDFDLPAGGAVYVYNVHGQAFGPYTGRGPNREGSFWSHTVSGDEIWIEFRNPAKASIPDAAFLISDVAFLGERFTLARRTMPLTLQPDKGTLCSFNESCVENADDYGPADWAAIDDAKGGVAQMLFQSGRFFYLCSGGLLADTDSATQVPLFITANHCISKGREANSLEAFFGFTESAYGCTDPDAAGVPSTLGSSILSSNRSSDYTLLQLDEAPPAGSVFMGWSAAPVAFSHGTDLYRISHPAGAPQAFSSHSVDTSAPTCNSWPRGGWIYSRDVIGATEGGSSGSPVALASGQVVGQLSGACGFNVNDPCDGASNATVDGALAAYFDGVAQWLDPSGGPGEPPSGAMHVASISVSVEIRGPWIRGVALVGIVDADGNPVSGADVTGSFSGDVGGTSTATTGDDGFAQLRSARTRDPVSAVQFCVDGVSHASLDYDAGANVEDCDTL